MMYLNENADFARIIRLFDVEKCLQPPLYKHDSIAALGAGAPGAGAAAAAVSAAAAAAAPAGGWSLRRHGCTIDEPGQTAPRRWTSPAEVVATGIYRRRGAARARRDTTPAPRRHQDAARPR